MDLHTIISIFDAPFGGTKTSGREVWPVIRLGNRRTVKGKRTQIPVTSDPSQDALMSDENPELPFQLTVESASNVAGREGALVKGYIERGTIRIGDKVELISPNINSQVDSRTGECIGVGNLSQRNQTGTQRTLVGVLVSGFKEENVSPGDVLRAAGG
jgi:translation elongation factor EF-Tu-like GTPase